MTTPPRDALRRSEEIPMKRLRTLIVSIVALIALATPVAVTTPTAAANTPPGSNSSTRYYSVYYRDWPHSSWTLVYRTTRLDLARYVAQYLQYWYGGQTFIQ